MVTLTYSKQNGYQVPNLRMDERENEPQTLGRFGRAREQYLMDHRKGLYNSMLLTGRLWAHQMDWVRRINNIRQSAEEIVRSNLISR